MSMGIYSTGVSLVYAALPSCDMGSILTMWSKFSEAGHRELVSKALNQPVMDASHSEIQEQELVGLSLRQTGITQQRRGLY